MCFSSAASFTAAVGLTSLGVLTLLETRNKKEIPFASIPLLFGIQQASEGLVWLSIQHGNLYLNSVFSHVFTFFAYIFWPLFIPLSVLLLEKILWRRKLLYLLEISGVALSTYFVYVYFSTSNNIIGSQMYGSLVYSVPDIMTPLALPVYITVTCLALMFSSYSTLRWTGLALSVSLLITYIFYVFAFSSVWCYFAAILSCIVYFFFRRRILRDIKK